MSNPYIYAIVGDNCYAIQYAMSGTVIRDSLKYGPAHGGAHTLAWLANEVARNFWRVRFTDVLPDRFRDTWKFAPFCGGYNADDLRTSRAVKTLIRKYEEQVGEMPARKTAERVLGGLQ